MDRPMPPTVRRVPDFRNEKQGVQHNSATVRTGVFVCCHRTQRGTENSDLRASASPHAPAVQGTGISMVGRKRGGLRCFVACSKAYARRISAGSLQAPPMKEIPTGSPKTYPAGTATLG